jgi:hypothetical protein
MSDSKLYRIQCVQNSARYDLAKISLQSDENYVVKVDDFKGFRKNK